MKINNKVVLVALLTVTMASSIYAETVGEHIDDATIATKTKTALIGNKDVPGVGINVEVSDGVVQLSGFVNSETEEAAAITTAQEVEGTKKVLDALVVFTGSRSMGETVDDTTISAKLKTELTKVVGLGSATAINTEVKQGQVLLAGFVGSTKVKNAAGDAAKGISGVLEVHNFIAIK